MCVRAQEAYREPMTSKRPSIGLSMRMLLTGSDLQVALPAALVSVVELAGA